MEKIGRIQAGDMLIAGEIEERMPAVTNGLMAYFPFDGTLNKIRNPKGTKILYAKSTGTGATAPIASYLSGAGASVTEIASLDTVDVNTAKQYDLIVADYYVWAVSASTILKMKEFVDAGISCVGQGNDTGTHYFVKSYTTSPTRQAHSILVDENSPLDLTNDLYNVGNGDVFGGIGELQNGAIPLYTRTDEGTIMGWYYQSAVSGAVLFFDQDGLGTNTEVMQQGIAFALNTSVGGTKTGNGVVLTNEGIFTQESTTNLWASPLNIYNNHNQPASLTATGELFMGQPVYRLKMTVTDATKLSDFRSNLYSHGVWGGNTTFKANTKYAASIYFKVVNKEDTVVGGVASNISGWTVGATEEIGDDWKRYTMFRNGTASANATDNIYFSFKTPSLELNEPVYIDFACPMIEEGRDYATTYVQSTKGSVSEFEISNLSLKNYSIAFKFKPTVEYYKALTSSYNKIMLKMIDISNTKEIRFSDYLSAPSAGATYSSPFFDLEPNANWGDNTISYHYHQNVAYQKNKWHNFVIIKSGNTLRIYVELDNVILADKTFTTVINDTYTMGKLVLGFGDSSVWNGAFKDLAVYDKVLSEAEIKKLTVSRLNITATGKILTSQVLERPALPASSKYFPLGENGNSEFNYITPAQELNTTHNDGAIWLGQAYTNLFTHNANGLFTVTNGKAFEVLTYSTNSVIYKHQFAGTGETYNYKGRDIPVVSGKTYKVSIEIFVSKDYNGSSSLLANVEQTGGTQFVYDMNKKGEWQKFVHTFTASADGNSRLLMYPQTGSPTTVGTKGYVLYKDFQMVEGNIEFPFVSGTRAYQRLNYNTADLTVNDWQEFSLVLSAKYSELGKYKISGTWSKYYFGINTANQLVFSWMQDGVQKSLTSSITVPKDKWVTIGLSVKNNTFIDMYLNGEKVQSQTTAFNLNGITSKFELNSADSTNSTYPLNAWIKDLIITSKALTAEEMALVCKKHMSSDKNKIRVRGQFLEGQTL